MGGPRPHLSTADGPAEAPGSTASLLARRPGAPQRILGGLLLPIVALLAMLQAQAPATRAQTAPSPGEIRAGSSAAVARQRLQDSGFSLLRTDANASPTGALELWWQSSTDTCLALTTDRRSALVVAAGPTRTSDCRRLLPKP